jgi:poly-gamma-glutamate synthase PgsB/CapB
MNKLGLVLVLLGILVLLGSIEGLRHRHNLRRIPIRIHVNGTRGKSSVTRLIAAGLRAGGISACAKTTGTAASMILPDGSEYPVYRPAGPNIIEQVRIVDVAADVGAKALVVECMALQPLLQSLAELRFVHATLGVITNVRADHLDVMGPTEEDVALALAGSIPRRGKLFTASERHLDVLRRAADDRDTEMVALTPAEIDAVGRAELDRFSYLEHASNLALALRVCAEVGVDRQTALEGMWSARPDPGVLTLHEIAFFGRRLLFANGLAANDPESTGRIWRTVLELVPNVERRIALFNCRVDRPDRSRQLGEACVDWPPADNYVLMGTGTYIFARAATRRGLDIRKLVIVENREPNQIFETLLERCGRSALIMGMGNVHGGGEELAQLFRNRGTAVELRAWS